MRPPPAVPRPAGRGPGRTSLDEDEFAGVEPGPDEVAAAGRRVLRRPDLLGGEGAVLGIGTVRQEREKHHVDGLPRIVRQHLVVDHAALLEHAVGDRAVEHGEDLGHGGGRAATLDRLAVALAELPEEVAQRQGRGQLAGPHEHLPFVAVLLEDGAAVGVQAVGVVVVFEGLLDVLVGRALLGEVDVDDLRVRRRGGPLEGPLVVGDERQDRVPELLGRHPLQRRPREPEGCGRRRVVEDGPTLVGVGRDEHADELAEVELEPEHLVGEMLEQLGVGGLVVVPEVVDRLDDPHPHHLPPEAVGDGAGELAVVGRRQPGSEFFPAVGVRGGRRDLAPEHLGRDGRQRLVVVVLVVVGQEELGLLVVDAREVGVQEEPGFVGQLLVLHLRLDRRGDLLDLLGGLGVLGPSLPGVFLRHAPLPVPHAGHPRPRARGEGGEFVELVLRPLVERVVVALGAADLRAEEHPDGVVDVGQRHPLVAELEADRGVLPELAVGREHLADPGVVRLVLRDRPLHPVEIGLEEEVLLGSLAEPEDVGPEVVGVADVVGAFEQRLDQVVPLRRRLRVEKLHRLVERGNPAAELQVDPADELAVVERITAGDLVLLPVLLEQRVDPGGRRGHVLPGGAVHGRDVHDRARRLAHHGLRKVDLGLLVGGLLRRPGRRLGGGLAGRGPGGPHDRDREDAGHGPTGEGSAQEAHAEKSLHDGPVFGWRRAPPRTATRPSASACRP
jgi:hypothetical protein